MSEINTNLDSENYFAQAAEPGEFEDKKVEAINDPERSLRLGLEKLYIRYSRVIRNKRQNGLINQDLADKLTTQVDRLALTDLGYEVSKIVSLVEAKEIMGSNMYFGPEEVEKAGIEIKEMVPPIPFNEEELLYARKHGQMLIYRTDTTLKELDETLSPKLKTKYNGAVMSVEDRNYEDKHYYHSARIQPSWALVSKSTNPISSDRTYLYQSELIAAYLEIDVFNGKPLPLPYQEAIDELNAQKKEIKQMLVNQKASLTPQSCTRLTNLKINQFFRQTPGEVVYDWLVCFLNSGEDLYEDENIWTSAIADGRIVYVCCFGVHGALINQRWDYDNDKDASVTFCRRGADLKS